MPYKLVLYTMTVLRIEHGPQLAGGFIKDRLLEPPARLSGSVSLG